MIKKTTPAQLECPHCGSNTNTEHGEYYAQTVSGLLLCDHCSSCFEVSVLAVEFTLAVSQKEEPMKEIKNRNFEAIPGAGADRTTKEASPENVPNRRALGKGVAFGQRKPTPTREGGSGNTFDDVD